MQLNKEILRLAVPNILSGLTVPLLGMVDMFLMGQQQSQVYMGAVALGGVIFNIVYWNFAFLRMSVSGMTAQSVGRQNKHESAQVLFRGLLIALFGGLLLLLTQSLVERVGFGVLNGSADVKNIAKIYFYTRIWAAPAAILLFVFSGWFIGMQNTVYPMWIALTVNMVNVIVSYILVTYFDMQARGIAMGSVIAQYSGLILCCLLFLKKYQWVFHYFKLRELLIFQHIKDFMHVSGAIFFRTLLIIIVFTFFTSSSAGMGDDVLAANGALIQFLFLFSYFSDGFANAAEALVGKFYGAKDQLMLNKSIQHLFLWGLGTAIIFTFLYYFAGDRLITFFTPNPEVVAVAQPFLIWIILLPMVSFATFILDGIYIGVTASKQMLITMLISTALFFFLPFYLLLPIFGNHAIWISMLSFMLCRSISQKVLLKKVIQIKK
ncbi:MAG: MATE family efflux transporter [Bacteroidales bacterium]|jgi:MATE family multidrug resistance protein|nr:MATE family efflux transporter [Bacteroidales bacterium]